MGEFAPPFITYSLKTKKMPIKKKEEVSSKVEESKVELTSTEEQSVAPAEFKWNYLKLKKKK